MEERQTKTRTRTNPDPDPDQPGPGPRPTQITVIVITDPPTKMEEDAARCQIKGLVILRTPPTEEEGGGIPKKVAQCKRVKFGGRRAGPTRQYNSRGVQWGANPTIHF